MSVPRVSIVVPSYNHARFAAKCAESVLAQTFGDWEMVVVDDGSTDDSLEVWRSFDDPRIQVHSNERNVGTYATQNRGVALSKADLFAILNSDDFWEPEKLERQVRLLESDPEAAFCYTLGWTASEDGELRLDYDNHADCPIAERQELLPYLLEVNRVFASSVLWRLEWARFDESLRYSGDWIALLKASSERHCACVPERLSTWRIHGASTHQASDPVTLEEIRIRRAILRDPKRWFSPRFDARLVREKLSICAMHLAALYVLWNSPREARRAAWTAARLALDKRAPLKRWAACFLPIGRVRRHMWFEVGEGQLPARLESVAPLIWP